VRSEDARAVKGRATVRPAKRTGFDSKSRDVARQTLGYIGDMNDPDPIDADAAWTAFDTRDRRRDGRFVIAVHTTGIYCKPSCPARRPKRDNVAFYRDGIAAQAAGYRACLRCKPDDAAREHVAVAHAAALLAGEDAPALDALAAAVGYAPHHFHRLFKRATGVTPAAYARGLRAGRAAIALSAEGNVTQAIYEAGYSAPSRFYEQDAKRLGMTPSIWAKGGAGAVIRWTIADTSLGPMLIAATDKGLCRVTFEEGEADLRARFPRATILAGDAVLATLAAQVVALVETPTRDLDLPLDVQGSAFQEAVWQALRDIPPGETRTYRQLAAAAGNPQAVRAAGTACGANPVSIVTPCHRAQRADGSMAGYAWGIDRKIALRKREGVD
jgi:AraC family transcriptional regulator of adaptative response/methylated-DNA-[protein]-cysteine methyltransferase